MTTDNRRAIARSLRKEGLSLTSIVREVGCSKSSASAWTRGVRLNERQRQALTAAPYTSEAIRQRAESHARTTRNRRLEWQRAGHNDARTMGPLHVMGCMLYWGEGAKSRNSVALNNTDVDLLRTFISFLKDCYGVAPEQLHFRITAYTDLHTEEEIIRFWTGELDLGQASPMKHTFNPRARGGQIKSGGKRPYGLCSVLLHRTDVVQRIYGSIAEYAGIEAPEEWLG